MPVNPEILPVVVSPAILAHHLRRVKRLLVHAVRLENNPLERPVPVHLPIHQLRRRVVHQIRPRFPDRILFGPRRNLAPHPRKIDQHITLAKHQALNEHPPSHLEQRSPTAIAVAAKPGEKLLHTRIRSPKPQVRRSPEQSRRIPIDARPEVVLIEHPREPFEVDIIRLLLPPNQIQAGVPPQLFAAHIEIPVPLPHPLAVPILRILLFKASITTTPQYQPKVGQGSGLPKPSPTTTTKSGVNPRISRLAIPRQMSSQART